MKIKNYTPTKGFIWILLLIIFIAWLVYKCVPLTEKDQDALIHSNMERERIRLAEEFDSYTQEDFARLPKFDSRKYFLIKRNGRFWLIPREYYGANGFTIRVIDIDKLIGKKWEGDIVVEGGFRVFMYSPQYYNRKADFLSSDVACKSNTFRKLFTWNGVIINIDANTYPKKITDNQYLDICLTALKILNEEVKEIHFVN
ncbi:hypothetical protein IC789_05855 [Acinetobacter seifertii]|uniref:Uncharacterized protein n=3 Tax=Acinetobacter TaxID=469 RepID=A0A7H2WUH1_9GAMM|nr:MULTISPECIES: hypothetical protein [Acinetobacter]MCG8283045.1 hypothetical protein [Acinetobacter seifertii]ONN51473.1 hypothetical protein AC058_18960 [Acinetobacter genomosp. 33YU]QNX11260.1 hypothetical protein IC794_14155 [Acinetobacter seifertii]QNX20842.1 hypothetical protein IC792_05870 [Acinetobacter seifertii]QNX27400.1 hypothetical protein IC791_05635 [Acinetobacter seifertii]